MLQQVLSKMKDYVCDKSHVLVACLIALVLCRCHVDGASLAFVIDTTGSMGDDIDQVQSSANDILKAATANADHQYRDFVLVPFNDPDIGPVTRTRSHSTFKSRLNALEVDGGDDCPEMSMGGIMTALRNVGHGSIIYVFTDASAKDHKLIDKVVKLIHQKKSTVVFLLTGKCGGHTDPDFVVYKKIAAVSGGEIFDLVKSDVSEVLDYVKHTVGSKKVPIMSLDVPSGGTRDHPFHVDPTITQVVISVSGPSVKVTIKDQSGKPLSTDKLAYLVNLQNAKVVSINKPASGRWIVRVTCGGAYTVRVTANSKLEFAFGFYDKHTTSLGGVQSTPAKGWPSYLIISLEKAAVLYHVLLASRDGKILVTHKVRASERIASDVYAIRISRVPDQCFYVMVIGKLTSGGIFQRMSNLTVCPIEGPTTTTAKPTTTTTTPKPTTTTTTPKPTTTTTTAKPTTTTTTPKPTTTTTKQPTTTTAKKSPEKHEGSDCGDDNICLKLSQEELLNTHFHYEHKIATKFIQCSLWRQCFVHDCFAGTRWFQDLQTCSVDRKE